ncbi:hypothetical protein CRG98_010007 [Punica granatum]|uniref:Integrase catalytic domain-containing protein n=1 Tax=Punica granatum TaxID=22663 RepID=A0A2I0KM95_PUNGR|nr:hypothetical protein CRG98_010007 [Punica granatum]
MGIRTVSKAPYWFCRTYSTHLSPWDPASQAFPRTAASAYPHQGKGHAGHRRRTMHGEVDTSKPRDPKARMRAPTRVLIRPTEEINISTAEEQRTLRIEASLNLAQKAQMIDFRTEYQEVFAWSYADMPCLDPSIVKHFLLLDTEKFPPKRQHQRRQQADILLHTKEEVVKQIDAGFLEMCNYSEWIANIVPVEKKNWKIQMAEEDKIKMTFIAIWGTFYYKVMSFNLKNVRATYQRAMVILFYDMMHKEIEVYFDDIIHKSKEGEDNLVNLKQLFNRLKKYKLRFNLAKCTFGVKSEKLLGFVVSEKGIEVDPDKVKAIMELPPPSTVREVRSFLGLLNYIARFIANLTDKCQLLFRLLRKNAAVEWDDECQKAFDTVKAYLVQPPMLVQPSPERPLIMYLTVRRQSMGCMLGQKDNSTHAERVIYYLSKKFTEGESNSPEIEKMCCALVWVMQRLRQCTLYHTICLLSKMDPLKYLLDSPSSMRNIAKWRCQLTEYDIEYVSRTSMKGQAITDHLAEFPIDDDTPINSDIPNEGILQIDFPCINNIAEYEACILGLQVAVDLKVKELEVFADSMLTIFQTLKQWKTKDPKLVLYHEYLKELTENFENISFTYTPRMKNQFADALATLASMVSITKENLIKPLKFDIVKGPAHCDVIEVVDGKPWYADIMHLLQTGQFPAFTDRHERRTLRLIAAHFFLSGENLYRRSFDATLLRESKLITLASVTAKVTARFFKRVIIAQYRVHVTLIIDKAKNLNNKLIDELCAQFKIQHHNSSPYRPQMNGAVEAANKNIKKIVEKMTVNFKDWHEMLPFALLAYRTSICSSTGETSYSLVYDMEAALPVEWAKQHYEQLNLIDEKRLPALCHGQCYQQRMARAFNKKVRLREFSPGDLVLRKVLHIAPDSRGKFAYKYDGSFIVKEVSNEGAIILNDMDGNENALPVNVDAIKKYYP